MSIIDIPETRELVRAEKAEPAQGSKPLREPRHERYARARAMLVPAVEAYRQAGYGENSTVVVIRSNAWKLETDQAIQLRIAYLSRQDEELLRAKRQRLEEFLWTVHEANYADYWETDEDGKQRLRNFADLTLEQQRLVESLKFTEKGNPIFSTYSKVQANTELRKLLGIDAASKRVGDVGDGDFARMTDVELKSELARMASELGVRIDVAMSFTPTGER